MKRSCRFLCMVGLAAFLSSSALAQYTGNNQTNIISGVTSNWTGDYLVGYSYVFDALLIQNGGVLSNSPVSYVGYTVGADSNAVIVSGPGSQWGCLGDLFLGWSGSGNSLVIRDGGKVGSFVTSQNGMVGHSGSNNWALVTDPGSAWFFTGQMTIGETGAGNTMIISNGGVVVNGEGVIGNGIGSSSNRVLVTGVGSTWTNRAGLLVGNYGAGNTLVISNGSKVYIGAKGGALGVRTEIGGLGANASGNSVLVTGAGSSLASHLDLAVGVSGTNNSLTIANSGLVVMGNVYVGWFAGATNSRINVSGGFLFATNRFTFGTNQPSPPVFDIRRGALNLNDGTVTADKLLLTNGSASVIAFNGGLLNSKGTAVTNTQQFVVGNGVASANFHLLGGVHSFNNGLRIRSNSFLTGCGTITGTVVVDAGGSVATDCGLTFTGSVTNNGILHVQNGSVLEVYGPFVNNGILDLMDGTTNFHSTFINNGTIINASYFRVTSLTQEGDNMRISWPAVGGRSYVVQVADDVGAGFTDLSPDILIPGTSLSTTNFLDLGGATNAPSRFYRARLLP